MVQIGAKLPRLLYIRSKCSIAGATRSRSRSTKASRPRPSPRPRSRSRRARPRIRRRSHGSRRRRGRAGTPRRASGTSVPADSDVPRNLVPLRWVATVTRKGGRSSDRAASGARRAIGGSAAGRATAPSPSRHDTRTIPGAVAMPLRLDRARGAVYRRERGRVPRCERGLAARFGTDSDACVARRRGRRRAGRPPRASRDARGAGCCRPSPSSRARPPHPTTSCCARARPRTPARPRSPTALRDRVQWGVVQSARSAATNTLFSIAHPALALEGQALFAAADVIHLHWTSWTVAPATLRHWLAAGRRVVWTLHDLWPMTGGCHYPAGCEQYRTACLQCPQLADAWSLVPNAFAEKRAAWSGPRAGGGGALRLDGGARGRERHPARLPHRGDRRTPSRPSVFAPRPDRDGLRAAWGLGPTTCCWWPARTTTARRARAARC